MFDPTHHHPRLDHADSLHHGGTKTLNFLGLPPEQCDPKRSAAAIIPVPYDLTSTWQKGADRGPAAIITASQAVELYDIESGSAPCEHGIATLEPVTTNEGPEHLATLVRARVASVLNQRQLPIVLGGEHSVTIGAVEAVAARHPDLTILQIDAHGDTRETYEGSTHNHACVMARAREHGRIVQVGIRSIDQEEVARLERENVFYAHEIAGRTDTEWMDRVVERLTSNVYITIDLDAFDPSLLPATGTPEPGGLQWYEVTRLLERVTRQRNIVGFDVVELLPQEGEHASSFIAAKLVYRLFAMVMQHRSK